MTSSKEQVTSHTPQKPVASLGAPSYESARTRFLEAHMNYGRAQQDSQAAGLKRYEEAYRGYLSEMQTISADAQKRFEEAYRNYVRIMQEAWLKQDADKLAAEARSSYASAMQSIQVDARERCEAAFSNYTGALQETQDMFRKQSLDTYRTYLKTQQETWAGIDVDAVVDAAAMAAGKSVS